MAEKDVTVYDSVTSKAAGVATVCDDATIADKATVLESDGATVRDNDGATQPDGRATVAEGIDDRESASSHVIEKGAMLLDLYRVESNAIGRARGGSNSGHGEEMALNALLTEMDGFSLDPRRPVFVLAATNFDVEEGKGGMGTIDAALARQFDRKILVDLPNKDDRRQYINMMLKKNKTHQVTKEMIERLSGRSTGMSLDNMAAVMELANRMAVKQMVPLNDNILDEAYELTKHGAKKEWGYEYLERVARHESGHAFMCYLAGNTPSYLTIVARGGHGGYMEHSDADNSPLQTKEALIGRIRTSLGGRAAEIVYYGEKDGISTGASGDLESATRVARAMICNYGMDDEIGMAVLSQEEATRGPLAGKIHERVSRIIDQEMGETVRIIKEAKPRIDKLVYALLEKNKLTREEMEELLAE